MNFQQKTRKFSRMELWNEYCGYLELSVPDYMYIQKRLMQEQITLWSRSGLGKSLLGEKTPQTVDEFRAQLPLTRYEDYADILLARKCEMLPAQPVIWIETTWEGGIKPVKLAPYTRDMLDSYKHNLITMAMLVSGRGKGDYDIVPGDRFLYGGAPLPYETGLIPSLLGEEMYFEWLPDADEYGSLSFSQRMKKGFSLAFGGGIDYFFAIGSVANYITESFSHMISGGSGGGHSHVSISPKIAARYLKAKYVCRRDRRALRPSDLFHIKGFACTGTDARCYRERLAKAWGVTPVEIAAGTESTCVGCETWEQTGMVLFPDSCFYEFIPEDEMLKNIADPAYTPRTCLMDEVQTGCKYELVISVLHGGAFMRYRIGDVYRCVSFEDPRRLPRFTYVDRCPDVIDIAGFTRITEKTIREVLRMSRLDIGRWVARKEYEDGRNPYLHLYLEIPPEAIRENPLTLQVLSEHLSVYFRYFDSDYKDLKRLLNMEPLKIDLLPHGSIERFERETGRTLPCMNPAELDMNELKNSIRREA